jgi:hypothetical protein
MEVILWLDAQTDIVEVLVRLRDILTLLTDQDASQLSAKDQVGERDQLLLFRNIFALPGYIDVEERIGRIRRDVWYDCCSPP